MSNIQDVQKLGQLQIYVFLLTEATHLSQPRMIQKLVESQPSLTMMQSRSQPWLRQSSQPLLLEAQHVAWPSMNSSSQPCPQDIQMQLARLVVGNLGLASQLPNWQLGLAVQNSNTAASQLSGLAISRASPSCQKAPIHGSPGELRGLVHISSSMLLGYASGSCFSSLCLWILDGMH